MKLSLGRCNAQLYRELHVTRPRVLRSPVCTLLLKPQTFSRTSDEKNHPVPPTHSVLEHTRDRFPTGQDEEHRHVRGRVIRWGAEYGVEQRIQVRHVENGIRCLICELPSNLVEQVANGDYAFDNRGGIYRIFPIALQRLALSLPPPRTSANNSIRFDNTRHSLQGT